MMNTMPMSDSKLVTNILISAPPLASIKGKEGVDLALVCAAFEHQVNLIFVDYGVFHLLEAQNSQHFKDKLHDKQLKALEFYDIDALWVESESLDKFNINTNQLIANCHAISSEAIAVKTSEGPVVIF
jgi:tRNA 2-thiouridine synthesizing protein C